MIDLSFLLKYGTIGSVLIGIIAFIYRSVVKSKTLKKDLSILKTKHELVELEKVRTQESLERILETLRSYEEKKSNVSNGDVPVDDANKLLNSYKDIDSLQKTKKIQ